MSELHLPAGALTRRPSRVWVSYHTVPGQRRVLECACMHGCSAGRARGARPADGLYNTSRPRLPTDPTNPGTHTWCVCMQARVERRALAESVWTVVRFSVMLFVKGGDSYAAVRNTRAPSESNVRKANWSVYVNTTCDKSNTRRHVQLPSKQASPISGARLSSSESDVATTDTIRNPTVVHVRRVTPIAATTPASQSTVPHDCPHY